LALADPSSIYPDLTSFSHNCSLLNTIYACGSGAAGHIHAYENRRTTMTTEVLMAAIAGVLILGYLTYTVVRPEKF